MKIDVFRVVRIINVWYSRLILGFLRLDWQGTNTIFQTYSCFEEESFGWFVQGIKKVRYVISITYTLGFMLCAARLHGLYLMWLLSFERWFNVRCLLGLSYRKGLRLRQQNSLKDQMMVDCTDVSIQLSNVDKLLSNKWVQRV